MKAIKNAVDIVLKRPLIIIVFGLIFLTYCIIDFFNPLYSIIFNLGTMTQGDNIGSILSALQFLINPGIFLPIFLVMLFFSLFNALFLGFVFSGAFSIIKDTIQDCEKRNGEFLEGIKNNFYKVFLISFVTIFLGLALIIVLAVISVPALVITRACLEGKMQFLFIAIILDIVTILLLFFVSFFFKAYMFYWYPSAIYEKKHSFKAGKRMVDKNFWNIAVQFLGFDIVFIAFLAIAIFSRYMINSAESHNFVYRILLFMGNWTFVTCYFTTLAIFVFSTCAKGLVESNVLQGSPNIISNVKET